MCILWNTDAESFPILYINSVPHSAVCFVSFERLRKNAMKGLDKTSGRKRLCLHDVIVNGADDLDESTSAAVLAVAVTLGEHNTLMQRLQVPTQPK